MSKTKILIAPDSFKECCDSVTLTKLISSYLKTDLSGFDFIAKPLSDGGDGFLESLKYNKRRYEQKYYVIKCYENLLREIPVIIIAKQLFIESADVIGLKLIHQADRNPLMINTAPLGELLHKIDFDVKSGYLAINQVIIGIGGTSTNDLGLGVSSKFGMKLLNESGTELNIIPEEYSKAINIIWQKPSLSFKIKAITDVNIPLIGEEGAVALFARQKGAAKEDLLILEQGFKHILHLIKARAIYDKTDNLPGAGGGLAAGLKIFFGAELITSKQFIENYLNLNEIIGPIKYVITGEGRFDVQSFYGKSSGIVLEKYKNAKRYVICGNSVLENVNLLENTRIVELVKYFNSEEESIRNFEKGIKLACEEIISEINQEV